MVQLLTFIVLAYWSMVLTRVTGLSSACNMYQFHSLVRLVCFTGIRDQLSNQCKPTETSKPPWLVYIGLFINFIFQQG